MYYFYGKINRGQASRPLYRGCPLFGGSVIRGFTVLQFKTHLLLWLPNREGKVLKVVPRILYATPNAAYVAVQSSP